MSVPLRICVTGAPCSGKTTLARELAGALGWPWVPEAARLYADEHPAELTFDDVEPIARLALDLEARAAAHPAPGVVLDTDLLSTAIYSHFYYGRAPAFVRSRVRRRPPHLYVLCRADLPFEPEAHQRGPAHDQRALAAVFEQRVLSAGTAVALVEGAGPGRTAAAIDAVRAWLDARPA